MQQLIEKIFGKPYSKSKVLLFSYWSGILFYVIALFLFIMQATVGGQWLSVLAVAIGFPILFRIVYGLNANIMMRLKEKGKRSIFLLAGLFIIITIIFVGSTLLLADNLAINASKTQVNGNVLVSIGSLKGSYSIDEVRIIEEGMVGIPYRTNVGEGDLLLTVQHVGEIMWEKQVSPHDEGMIQFYGEEGRYSINLYTEKAEDIVVEVITRR
ncbi:hypothetical protein [Alkalihalobacterium elongatum]|uniref:hypothetical protein n=1 Tax=Alkalihalobacterium elongatum TaxID=2675466 RepID=UPI001C1FCC29|nr:hypothetical protein [Alkalihalobacterium elongatum]